MFPGIHAAATPDKQAVIAPALGQAVTYRELDERSTRIAHYLRDTLGLVPGDVVALVSDNDLRVFDVYWAAIRSGMYITAINHHLSAAEAEFILRDCGAKVLFASAAVSDAVATAGEIDALIPAGHRIAWAGPLAGFVDYDDVLANSANTPLVDQPRGTDMLYSSGTTGRPKGIKPAIPPGQVNEVPDLVTAVFGPVYGFDADTVYLCPAPLYHAAPLRYCAMVNSLGGTIVLMDHFDAETALRYINEFGVTHSQWVPTMFVRMLKLPDEVRNRYDVSSMKAAIHAAAPCPIGVKRAMIEWWGPVINEYYAATESAGVCLIGSADALTHPGSVGKAVLGIAHICGEHGEELPTGEVGTVYFEREQAPFVYHNDPEKTRKARHPKHETWSTTGDVGYLDDEGFLYLTDRAAFMIISGGVNIYPQEAENVLINHPAVFDVAVLGIPDAEMGEQVKACVQLAEGYEPSQALATELIDFVKASLSAFKAPRSVDFVDELPRTPTGKMVKGELRKRYV